MAMGPSDLLIRLVELSSYLWAPVTFLLALASLVLAIACTIRRRYLAGAWLMFAAWSVFFCAMLCETAVWSFHIGLDTGLRSWLGHGLSLVEMACELLFGVSILLFRPAREVAEEDLLDE